MANKLSSSGISMPGCSRPSSSPHPEQNQAKWPWPPTISIGVHLAEDLFCPLLWGRLIFRHFHYRGNHLIDRLGTRSNTVGRKRHGLVLYTMALLLNLPNAGVKGRHSLHTESKLCSCVSLVAENRRGVAVRAARPAELVQG